MDKVCSETGAPALWRRFKDNGDLAARERLVLNYAPLVKYVAGRIARGLPAHVEEADLISYGLLGLISAIERFDPSRKNKFETYAVVRIRGAILDELRAQDWVPRSVRADAGRLERTSARLAHRLRRTPRDREIADELGIPVKQLDESRRNIAKCSVVALEAVRPREDRSGEALALFETIRDPNALDPALELDSHELKERLAHAIASLAEKERIVIALYYFEDLTLREIGEVLGVTESRVSQLRSKAMLRLKVRLSRVDHPFPADPAPRSHASQGRERGRRSGRHVAALDGHAMASN